MEDKNRKNWPKDFRAILGLCVCSPKNQPNLKFSLSFWNLFWGPHKKAQNGRKMLGSIFPIFFFQKSSGLDWRADLVIKIQGDLSWDCPFQELEFAIQHFKSEGYEQSQFLHDCGAWVMKKMICDLTKGYWTLRNHLKFSGGSIYKKKFHLKSWHHFFWDTLYFDRWLWFVSYCCCKYNSWVVIADWCDWILFDLIVNLKFW